MTPSQTQLRFLCVDDDAVSRTLLHEHLTAAGHGVLLAPGARAGMDVLREQPVQIVVADWIMPSVSGLDFCRWVRAQRGIGDVHFVMLTVYSERQRLIEAFEAGVDDFLSKPLHGGELLARLHAWSRLIGLKEQLARLATVDELTGLLNRREGLRRLHAAWTKDGAKGAPLACAIVDVDNFKNVNDRYGHGAGDKVLRHVAHVLQASVPDRNSVYRMGGDEFLITFDGQTLAEAAGAAERCTAAVAADPVLTERGALAVTISVGLADRSDARSVGELLDVADRMLYQAKSDGKNRTTLARFCA